jgi:inosine-uridine nucleoside N-ribohydrolase
VVKDPEAVRRILGAKIPITLLPVETTSQLMISGPDLDAIGRSDPAGHYVATKSRSWLWFWTQFLGTEGGPIFDAAAILAVAHPNQFSFETRFATVDVGGNLIVSKGRRSGTHAVTWGARLSRGASPFVAEKLRHPQPD